MEPPARAPVLLAPTKGTAMYDETTRDLARDARRRLGKLASRADRMDRDLLEDLMSALDKVRDNARARREERDAR